MSWWTYVQQIAGQASAREISRRTGIGQTSVNRWQHASPKPENVATFARTYERPVLEAFVAAGFLTEEEAGTTEIPTDLTYVPGEVLIAEMKRRLKY
ncbi:XRE family transcriptional regulator [Nonomuraea phyllanthi]|uniref:XRE family transcriptional regulator n=1 Tax=Nonomuraea phyllanthi TaxID=2219224 RepID=A0A5C4V6G5_9ACTN|nr:XRE family transcriptional regulator [Nonomuraea phyllanthi]KAB8186947.1 XRE family transcriptional regulator [Nonomuraea phyllanthi]